jgi:hypothetical protein
MFSLQFQSCQICYYLLSDGLFHSVKWPTLPPFVDGSSAHFVVLSCKTAPSSTKCAQTKTTFSTFFSLNKFFSSQKNNCTKRLLVNFKSSLLLTIIYKCTKHYDYLQTYLQASKLLKHKCTNIFSSIKVI